MPTEKWFVTVALALFLSLANGCATETTPVVQSDATSLSINMSGRGVISHTLDLGGSTSCTTLEPYPTPNTCQRSYNPGTVVTLQAGSGFLGWSGPCSGTGTCTVTMSQARSVGASFSGF